MSLFDPLASVPDVPTWRCQHCRTLQPETTTCRACGRSAVTCRTCQLYRRSVVGGLGFCAADPTRAPLGGDEVRSCWVNESSDRLPEDGLFVDVPRAGAETSAAGVGDGSAVAPEVGGGSAVAPDGPGRRTLSRSQPARAAGGRLVEAPAVPPAGEIRSELRRRLDDEEA